MHFWISGMLRTLPFTVMATSAKFIVTALKFDASVIIELTLRRCSSATRLDVISDLSSPA